MRRQLVGIHLPPHRELLRAVDKHARHAADHGDALRQQGIRIFVNRIERQRVGIDREVQHRLFGRVDLLIRRRARHAGGQAAAGARDGGLNVLRSRVDLAVQRELNRNRGVALRVGRVHRLHAGDGGKLALERRSH